ncbi:hypothetical protein [Paenibacillus albus]|uniref:Uncharacterized protein n=1 Tax=Paenibacillus albus TaxID=2495582 RepID=A0A3Q8X3S6_9BACL|nr:hypothetical protein [Paenibacillus albus]AZN39794.1 hypothetical protein EJC50_09165 [Paenibacillus albus]
MTMTMARIEAGKLAFLISNKGELIGLHNTVNGVSYELNGHHNPLLQIVNGREIEAPTSAEYDEHYGVLALYYEQSGTKVDVRIAVKPHYVTLEVILIAAGEGEDEVDALIWGPYVTKLAGSIGESVGVVHDGDFVVGMLALNAKTVGGWPAELPRQAYANETYADSKFEYGDSTAWPVEGGSLLQAFARNRTRGGRRPVWNLDDIEVQPLQGDEALLGGTAIALFGCAVSEVLDTIEAVELGEGLPHPMIEGEWGKKSKAANQSYLITDFSESTIDDAVAYTKKAGLKYVYHPDPFTKWGHFVLKPGQFPSGDESMRACVELAGDEGVYVGVHTLTNFTTLNDPYVTPVPHEGLQTVGVSRLVEAAGAMDDELAIDDPRPFNESLFRKSAKIGTELIEYESVSEQEPWKLLGVKRGVNETAAAAHEAGTAIGRLWDHPYDVFFPNMELQDKFTERLTELFQQTGLRQISFDGLEGCFATGHDGYGVNRFVKQCYEGWEHEVINDASIVVPNYLWHIFTRFNWGEPWGVSTREGQLEWRLTNQRYFARNFIPPMLGWFLVRSVSDRFEATTLDEIEWVLSKAAGFDAGFALVADMAVLRRNGNVEGLLAAVREWETARRLGVFSDEQRERMRDPKSDWHLEAAGEGGWLLYPVSISKPLTCSPEELQPGQPGGSDWAFFNKFGEQPLRFTLRVSPSYGNEDAAVKRPTFYTQGTYMTFETEIAANQYLVYDGGSMGRVYDQNWNLIREVKASAEAPMLRAGGQTLSFSCKFQGDPKPVVTVQVTTRGECEVVRKEAN